MADNEEKDDLLEEQKSDSVEVTKDTGVTEDSAVDDDAKSEEVSDKKPKKGRKLAIHPAHAAKLKQLVSKYWAKKKWTIPVSVLVLLLIILAIPYTRWMALGTVLKSQATVTVTDSATHAPVSGAIVSLGGKSLKTDAYGKVVAKPSLGTHSLSVSKQYYQPDQKSVTVTFSKSHNAFTLSIVANGRQVPITVTNKVTGQPLANAVIKVLSTEAKTDKTGKAIVVLPTAKATQKATLSLAGFNDTTGTVTVTDKDVATNHFTLTPAGKLYFLSNQTGKIDVVKTNLDGTDRQTVLAGTGSEDPNTTSLLASQDWKYLALLSHRSGDNASLYLIDTSTDKLTTMDEGKATFTLVGWAGDKFAYYVDRDYSAGQAKNIAIKTFDASAKKLAVAYETGATGNQSNYSTENLLWIQEIGTKLVWFTSWSVNNSQCGISATAMLTGKQAQIFQYDTTKNTTNVLKSYDLPVSQIPNYCYNYYNPIYSYQSVVYNPTEIYFGVSHNDNNNTTQDYDEYENGTITENSDEAKTFFSDAQDAYPTYLLSPSNNQTFWSEQRDGKNALFVGDKDGKNGKQMASLSDYQTYGWYSDNYLLLSKNSSELYILPADGSSTTPQKITDYYKPPTSYRGYGGGYGGI